jgi:hypothetical protein
MYFGWHGLASVGHILTLISIIFLCLCFGDSMIQNKTHTPEYFHLSRTSKRIMFYLFKINSLKYSQKLSIVNKKTLEIEEYKVIHY